MATFIWLRNPSDLTADVSAEGAALPFLQGPVGNTYRIAFLRYTEYNAQVNRQLSALLLSSMGFTAVAKPAKLQAFLENVLKASDPDPDNWDFVTCDALIPPFPWAILGDRVQLSADCVGGAIFLDFDASLLVDDEIAVPADGQITVYPPAGNLSCHINTKDTAIKEWWPLNVPEFKLTGPRDTSLEFQLNIDVAAILGVETQEAKHVVAVPTKTGIRIMGSQAHVKLGDTTAVWTEEHDFDWSEAGSYFTLTKVSPDINEIASWSWEIPHGTRITIPLDAGGNVQAGIERPEATSPGIEITLQDAAPVMAVRVSTPGLIWVGWSLDLLTTMPPVCGQPQERPATVIDTSKYLFRYPLVPEPAATPSSGFTELLGVADGLLLLQEDFGTAPEWRQTLTAPSRSRKQKLSPFHQRQFRSLTSDVNEIQKRLATFSSPVDRLLGQGSKSVAKFVFDRIRQDTGWKLVEGNLVKVPFEVTLQVGGGAGSKDGGAVRLLAVATWNLTTGALVNKEIPFVFIDGNVGQYQIIDLNLFALRFPHSDSRSLTEPTSSKQHGNINLQTSQLALTFRGLDSDQKNVSVLVPGNLGDTETSRVGDTDEILRRFRVFLRPEEDLNKAYLVFGPDGVSFTGLIDTSGKVDVDRDGVEPAQRLRGERFQAKPLSQSSRGVESKLVVRSSTVVEGNLFASMTIPGTLDLEGELSVELSQEGHGGRPKVKGSFGIASPSDTPICSLELYLFNAQISNPRLGMDWVIAASDQAKPAWALSAVVDAALSVSHLVPMPDGLEELKAESAIIAKDLDLVQLSARNVDATGAIGLQIDRFGASFFNKAVGFYVEELSLSWAFAGNDSITLHCAKIALEFRRIGSVSGGISVGNAELAWNLRQGLRVKTIHGASFKLSVAGSFDCRGQVAWKRTDSSKYFAIAGSLYTGGLMPIKGSVLFGEDTKRDGRKVTTMALTGARAGDEPLATGIVLKETLIGGGYNMQLGDLPKYPTPEDVLKKIDTLDPDNVENWYFVDDPKEYKSIIGRLMLGSNVGPPATPNAYVLSLLASLDSNGRFLAAGKLWLMSSPQFALDNASRPSVIGAMVLDSRQKAIRVVAQTRKGGRIETVPQLEDILDRTDANLRLMATPALLDVYLDRLSYRQTFFGASFHMNARWRNSVWRETVFQFVSATVAGRIGDSLSEGNGGFTFSANLDGAIEHGGILGRSGVATYGTLDIDVKASIEAFYSLSYSVPKVKCKRDKWKLSCSTSWEEKTRTFRKSFGSLSLGLHGGFAFESATDRVDIDSGVRVRIPFDANICGYRLNINPELSIRGHVVDRVQQRVRRFERQLDRAAKQLENASKRKPITSKRRAAKTAQENWFLVKTSRPGKDGQKPEDVWFLIPRLETPWFTPRVFDYEGDDGVDGRLGLSFQKAGGPDDGNLAVTGVTFTYTDPDLGVTTRTICPGWDPRNWVKHPDSSELAKLIAQPQEGETSLDWRRMWAATWLFFDTALPDSDTQPRRALSDSLVQRSLETGRLTGLKLIEDPRPRLRPREVLRDTDRVSLPPEAYPFTYKPRSASKYEDAVAAVVREFGREFADDVGLMRAARAVVIRKMFDEAAGNPGEAGCLFDRIDFGDLDDEKHVGRHAWIRSEDIIEDAGVTITRADGKKTKISKTADRKANASLVVIDDEFLADLTKRVRLHRPCEEYVQPTDKTEAGSDKAEPWIVAKLPVDLRGLFADPEDNGTITHPEYYEAIDHFRVLRQIGSGKFELIASSVLPPVVPMPTYKDSADQIDGAVLLQPFLITDRIPVPSARKLPKITYKVLIAPIGMGGHSDRELEDKNLALRVDWHPYVPSETIPFPADVAFGFHPQLVETDFATDALVGVLYHMSPERSGPTQDGSETDDTPNARTTFTPIEKDELGVDAKTKSPTWELWYEPVPKGRNGFYSETVGGDSQEAQSELESFAPGSDKQDRSGRVSKESARRELVSTIGRARLEPGAHHYEFDEDRARLTLYPRLLGIDESLGFRIFLKRAGDESQILQEIPAAIISKETVEDAGKNPAPVILPVEAIEYVAAPDPDGFFTVATPLAASSARPVHRVVCQMWNLPSLAGGVRISVKDDWTDRIVSEEIVEILDEAAFRRHKRDLADPEEWLLASTRSGARARLRPGKVLDSGVDDAFWDKDRFGEPFSVQQDGDEAHAWTLLDEELRKFATRSISDNADTASWYDTLNAANNVWTLLARFRSDPLNDDNKDLGTLLDEVGSGLLLFAAGIWPEDQPGNAELLAAFTREIDERRTLVNRADRDIAIGDPAAHTNRGLDVATAQRIAQLIDARRTLFEGVLEDGIRNPTDLESANTAGLPYETSLERTLSQIGLDKDIAASDIAALDQDFPLSMWYAHRMFDLDRRVDLTQGRRAAEKLLDKLYELARQIREGSISTRASAAQYTSALQRWLQMSYFTPRPKDADGKDKDIGGQFVLRPHHSMRRVRGEHEVLNPVEDDYTSLRPNGLDTFSAIDYVRLGSKLPPPFFVDFLNTLERLGLGVDVVLTHPLLGLRDQAILQDALNESLVAVTNSGTTHLVCRGLAADEDIVGKERVGFSFVKAITIPNALSEIVDTFVNAIRSGSTDRTWLTEFDKWVAHRSIAGCDYSDAGQLTGDAPACADWAAWCLTCLAVLLELAAPKPNRNFLTVDLEFTGGRFRTAPSVRSTSRIIVPMPLLKGQDLTVTISPVSRYHLVTTLVDGEEVPDSGSPKHSHSVHFPRVETLEGIPNPRNVRTLPLGDRLAFTWAESAAASDSIANALTGVRNRYVGQRFEMQHRIAQPELDGGQDGPASLATIALAFQRAGDIGSSTVFKSQFVPSGVDTVPLLPNDVAAVVSNLPYYFEFAGEAHEVFDLIVSAGDVAASNQSPPTFSRTKPTRLAYRTLKPDGGPRRRPNSGGDTHSFRIFPTRFLDNLSQEELSGIAEKGQEGEWRLPIGGMPEPVAVGELSDPSFSYMLLYEEEPPDDSNPGKMSPLAEVVMPWDDSHMKGALPLARALSTTTRIVTTGGQETNSTYVPVYFHAESKGNVEFVVDVTLKCGRQEFDPAKVYVFPNRFRTFIGIHKPVVLS